MALKTNLLLAQAGEGCNYLVTSTCAWGRISPIHFPLSDFLLLFFHGVEKNLAGAARKQFRKVNNNHNIIDGYSQGEGARSVGNSLLCSQIYRFHIFNCEHGGYGCFFFPNLPGSV